MAVFNLQNILQRSTSRYLRKDHPFGVPILTRRHDRFGPGHQRRLLSVLSDRCRLLQTLFSLCTSPRRRNVADDLITANKSHFFQQYPTISSYTISPKRFRFRPFSAIRCRRRRFLCTMPCPSVPTHRLRYTRKTRCRDDHGRSIRQSRSTPYFPRALSYQVDTKLRESYSLPCRIDARGKEDPTRPSRSLPQVALGKHTGNVSNDRSIISVDYSRQTAALASLWLQEIAVFPQRRASRRLVPYDFSSILLGRGRFFKIPRSWTFSKNVL